MAEREGFEPSIRFCRILTFQASAFDHSATAPHALEGRPCRQGSACRATLRARAPKPLCRGRCGASDTPPSADEIEAIARARAGRACPSRSPATSATSSCWSRNSPTTRRSSAMGIDDPFDLTGIYEGIPLTERSVEHSGTLPDRIRLFRRPILDEWADGDDTLEHLVAHVLIHEVGHHFGLSRRGHARARGRGRMKPLLRFEDVDAAARRRLLFEGLNLGARARRGAARHRAQRQRQVEPDPARRGTASRRSRAVSNASELALADDALALDRELPLRRALSFWGGGRRRRRWMRWTLRASPTCRCGCCRPARRSARRWRGSPRRARRCGCSTSRSTASTATASRGSTALIAAHLARGGAVLAASHRTARRELGAAGARPMIGALIARDVRRAHRRRGVAADRLLPARRDARPVRGRARRAAARADRGRRAVDRRADRRAAADRAADRAGSRRRRARPARAPRPCRGERRRGQDRRPLADLRAAAADRRAAGLVVARHGAVGPGADARSRWRSARPAWPRSRSRSRR